MSQFMSESLTESTDLFKIIDSKDWFVYKSAITIYFMNLPSVRVKVFNEYYFYRFSKLCFYDEVFWSFQASRRMQKYNKMCFHHKA